MKEGEKAHRREVEGTPIPELIKGRDAENPLPGKISNVRDNQKSRHKIVRAQEVSENLRLFLLRCPIGHKFRSDPALHAEDAHYCVECQRWFNEATLNDEIELEIRRLKEKEPANQI